MFFDLVLAEGLVPPARCLRQLAPETGPLTPSHTVCDCPLQNAPPWSHFAVVVRSVQVPLSM